MVIDFIRKADDGGASILFGCVAAVVFAVIALIRKAIETSSSDSPFSANETRTITPEPADEAQTVIGDAGSEPLSLSNETCVAEPEPVAVPRHAPQKDTGYHRLLPRHFVVLSLTMTGSDPAYSEIVEIGALLIDLNDLDSKENDKIESFHALVKPTGKISERVIEPRRITQEMVDKDGDELQEAMNQLVDFIGKWPLVFFDADSEMAFLRRAADRCGIKIANPYAGALNVAHKAYPNMPSGRVARLAKSLDSLDENVPSFVDACQRALSVFLVAVEASRERVRWTFSHDGVNAPSIPVKSISKAFVDFNKLLPPQFIVLDLETTGLSCTRNEIIEIGAILIDVDRINDSDIALSPCFQTLVKPSKKIPKKITEINGITQEMVDREGIDLKEAMGQFLEFIGDLPLVTYNADFDMGFLYQAAEKCDLIISNRYTCALKRARRAFLGLPSYRLAYVAKVQGLSDENTHRAVGDSQRAASVFLASVESLGMKVRWTRPPVIER